jgi:LysR family glycine cleavage system transcriptional activator
MGQENSPDWKPKLDKRGSLPPLNALRAFEAAARHSSFKHAADELGVTHGAVSRHVRLLEDWLGPPALFLRLNRRVELTATGAALLAETTGALDRLSAATARHPGQSGKPSAEILRVNAFSTFSLRWLLPRLAQFRARRPDVEVRLSTSNDPLDSLREPFDVIIRGGPDTFYGYTSRLFLIERRLPVCSPALFDRLPIMSVEDLSRHTLLHTAKLPRIWHEWFAVAGSAYVEPASTLVFDHFYLSIQAAVGGLGVAMGPSVLVREELENGRLIAPFKETSLPTKNYHAYIPENRASDPLIIAFCLWLEEAGL